MYLLVEVVLPMPASLRLESYVLALSSHSQTRAWYYNHPFQSPAATDAGFASAYLHMPDQWSAGTN